MQVADVMPVTARICMMPFRTGHRNKLIYMDTAERSFSAPRGSFRGPRMATHLTLITNAKCNGVNHLSARDHKSHNHHRHSFKHCGPYRPRVSQHDLFVTSQLPDLVDSGGTSCTDVESIQPRVASQGLVTETSEWRVKRSCSALVGGLFSGDKARLRTANSFRQASRES